MKICKKCNQEKPLEQYNKNKQKKDGIEIYCRECIFIKNQKYYTPFIPLPCLDPINNKTCCRCEIEKPRIEYSKCYKNQDGYLSYCKQCNNVSRNNSEWYKNQYNDYKKQWILNKHQNDINFKLKSNFRCRMNGILHRSKTNKNNTSLYYLGCTLDEYKQHLESQFKEGMTWKNHGILWEVDHIYPLSKFDLTIEENIKKAFNYKNTQPLYKIENRKKGNKI